MSLAEAAQSHSARWLEKGSKYQRNSSGALMIACVAGGRYIGYFEAHINAWDALAAIAMVREPGGWTNDFLADDGLTRGNPVLVSAPGFSLAIQRVLAPAMI